MKAYLFFVCLLCLSPALKAQDFYGTWEGIITEGKEQFQFKLTIQKGSKETPMVLGCRGCLRLTGSITDYRNVEKIIDFYGIVNADGTINLVDSKIVDREQEEGILRGRYQLFMEFKEGEPWLTGYYQDYSHNYRKKGQGRIYLKREQATNKA